jgi:hypothetical protein
MPTWKCLMHRWLLCKVTDMSWPSRHNPKDSGQPRYEYSHFWCHEHIYKRSACKSSMACQYIGKIWLPHTSLCSPISYKKCSVKVLSITNTQSLFKSCSILLHYGAEAITQLPVPKADTKKSDLQSSSGLPITSVSLSTVSEVREINSTFYISSGCTDLEKLPDQSI